MATYTHKWSGTSLGPFNSTQYGNGAGITVQNGIAAIYSGSGPNEEKLNCTTFNTAMAGPLHYAEIGYHVIAGAPPTRGSGVLVGGNAAVPTSGVICNISTWSSTNSAFIGTLDGAGLYTQRAQSTEVSSTGSTIRLEITHNGSHYVYTMYEDRVSRVSWEDTGDIVTPGNYVGFSSLGVYSSGWWGPQGAWLFTADDGNAPKTTGISSITGMASATL